MGGLFGLATLLWARLHVLVPDRLGLTTPKLDRLSTLVGMLAQDETELQMEAVGSIPRARIPGSPHSALDPNAEWTRTWWGCLHLDR